MSASNIFAVLLAAVFAAVGAAKVLRARPLVANFARFGYPSWSCPATGTVELTGAVLLLIGTSAGMAAGISGAALLIVVMLGALATHLRVHDRVDKLTPPILLLLMLGLEIALRVS